MLELIDAAFGYPTPAASLEIVAPSTLSVPSDTIVALIGPSGVGKTTLLKSLAGLLSPLHGSIIFNRNPVPTRATWYSPQTPVFLPYRNALQNALAARELDRALTIADLDTAREALAQLGLGNATASFPEQLSGGMRRRLTLIQGLLAERPLLLLDEPLAELDLSMRLAAERAAIDLGPGPGRSVLFASHDIDSVVAIADLVFVLQAPLPARVRVLSLGDRFPGSRRDPQGRRANEGYSETVSWVQRHLWSQWDAE